jgi:hypothetical protein
MYRWTASTQQARWIAERIWPWLRIKQRQALAIVELGRHREEHSARGRWNPIRPEWITYRERICRAVRAWNQRADDEWEPPLLPVINLPLAPRRIPPKSLAGLPWRYALGCMDDLGLILRAEIIWSKPNGLPESVQDRVRRSHEVVFHFTRQPRYYSAVDEIREAHAPWTLKAYEYEQRARARNGGYNRRKNADRVDQGDAGEYAVANPLGKLPGSVWDIPSAPLTVPAELGIDHFAAYPPELCRRIILGWSPPGICTECGEGRRPVANQDRRVLSGSFGRYADAHGADGRTGARKAITSVITGYACACPQPDAPTRPAVVLDPFAGTGTTMLVASVHGRTGIGVDRSADYCRLAAWRTSDPGERARALGVPKPPPVPEGQRSLFDDLESA